jgi:hypothetical protein
MPLVIHALGSLTLFLLMAVTDTGLTSSNFRHRSPRHFFNVVPNCLSGQPVLHMPITGDTSDDTNDATIGARPFQSPVGSPRGDRRDNLDKEIGAAVARMTSAVSRALQDEGVQTHNTSDKSRWEQLKELANEPGKQHLKEMLDQAAADVKWLLRSVDMPNKNNNSER